MLPPLVGGETYVVTWTQPTKNTDGTPIGTITKTEVQASLSPDFSTYYLWTATTPGATVVTVVNAPAGKVYWRARVFVGTASGDYSATAMTERQWAEATLPACEPVAGGSATATDEFVTLGVKGSATYWACKLADGTWKDQGTYGLNDYACIGRYVIARNITDPLLRQDTKKAIWTECVRPKAGDAEFYPWWVALRDAHRPAGGAPPPAIIYVVKPNAGYATRPAYTIANGSRTSVVAGRVAIKDAGGVPTRCDCGAFSVGAEPNRYCAVTGQENVATATVGDKLGPSAAVCAASAP